MKYKHIIYCLWFNPFKSNFTIVIFIHDVAILELYL